MRKLMRLGCTNDSNFSRVLPWHNDGQSKAPLSSNRTQTLGTVPLIIRGPGGHFSFLCLPRNDACMVPGRLKLNRLNQGNHCVRLNDPPGHMDHPSPGVPTSSVYLPVLSQEVCTGWWVMYHGVPCFYDGDGSILRKPSPRDFGPA